MTYLISVFSVYTKLETVSDEHQNPCFFPCFLLLLAPEGGAAGIITDLALDTAIAKQF